MGAQLVAWRFKVPAIILLFGLGLLFGPGLGLLHPSQFFGPMFRPLISLLVAVVVAEGGMALDFRQLREAGEGVARLTMLALPVNWGLGALAAHFITGFDWGLSLLFGAIVVVTGPTVVMPLLRDAKLKPRIAAFLRWEAILNDPVGAILAGIVLEIMLLQVPAGHHHHHLVMAWSLDDLSGALGASCLGAMGGVVAAWGLKMLFTRDMVPEIFKVPILLSMILIIYQACTLLAEGAGLVAVTAFGVAIANFHIPGMADLRRTKEALVVLIVSVLFIILTADLQRSVLADVSGPIMALALAMAFVVRPLGITLSTIGSSMTWQERLFVSWVAPRGIVAAAVAGTVGMKLLGAGVPGGGLITPAVFAVIAVTMLASGLTLKPLARLLHLTMSNKPTVVIVGARPWTIDLAECLRQASIPAMLVDDSQSGLTMAQGRGLPTLHAEVLSPHGEEALEERPVDYLIAATGDCIYNGMVCSHLAPHLGRQRVFQVSPGVARLDFYHGLSRDARGRLLGQPEWTYMYFIQRYREGWRFVSLEVTPDDLPVLTAMMNEVTPPLVVLVVKRGAVLAIHSAEEGAIVLQPGDTVVAFASPFAQRKLHDNVSLHVVAECAANPEGHGHGQGAPSAPEAAPAVAGLSPTEQGSARPGEVKQKGDVV
nr:sodium:proton antiporter [Formicincola oecophyllae]